LSNIKLALEGEAGYFVGLSLSGNELEQVREIITKHWLRTIKSVAGESVAAEFASIGIARYHEKSDLLNHAAIWPKLGRLLDSNEVRIIRDMSIFRKLEDEFGPFQLSDEENIGRELIYWRLVRPNAASDVGPLHADAWFWEMGHGSTPTGHQRIKVWVAIFCDETVSGFVYSPGSHKLDSTYDVVSKHGMLKPQISTNISKLNIVPFVGNPAEAIVFHDRLLHGGVVGRKSTRVNMEFTMFVKKEYYYMK